MRKAVIDVGSNSVLLTVEELTGGKWSPVAEATQVTALGEGVKQTGVLGERGMIATLEAIQRFFKTATDAGAEECASYGTMALRIATNTPAFQERAAAQGTPVFLLSGDDEAQLGFESVAYDPTFSAWDRISIIDPGGQSTELTTAHREHERWNMEFRKSFPIGTLALRGELLAAESPGPGELLRAAHEIDNAIGVEYLRAQAGKAVVLGAAGTNLVSIRERLTEWRPDLVHGQILTFEEVSKSVAWLSKMTDAERAAMPGMERGRERTIHIGALVLERVMNAIGVAEVGVSVRGWRHALLERGLPTG
jgi:exopolyphosphatase / guanosine-5'-triphosphate,3'-diphosphate pyrophosphatase